jgi:hypothetical protein
MTFARWELTDMGGRPIEVTATGGRVFVCDAMGSSFADMTLTGPQARELASALYDAIETLDAIGVREWPLATADGTPVMVKVSDGMTRSSRMIRITSGGTAWPDVVAPHIVVGVAEHAREWARVLREAAEFLEDRIAVN